MHARVAFPVLLSIALLGCPTIERSQVVASRVKVDFGTVEAGVAPFRLGVALTNPGTERVRLTELRLDPLHPSLSLEGLPVEALAPGERKLVTVVFTPTQEETVATALRVDAEDGVGVRVLPVTGRAVRLGGVARVDPGASCAGAPDSSLDYGTVTNGSAATRSVTIESTGSGPLVILKVSVSPADAGFSVEGAVPLALEPGQQATFPVRWDPRVAGLQAALVTFETNSQHTPRFEVPLCGTGLVSALCLSPSALDLGNVAVGSATSGGVTAASCGNLPIDVSAVTLVPDATAAPGLSLAAPPAARTLQPGDHLDVRVDFAASTLTPARADLRFSTSSPAMPEVTMRVGANLPPPCDVVITPDSLELFKAVGWARVVRLTNRGTTACILERASFVPATAPFQLERALILPAMLPPGGSMELNVEYLPSPNDTTRVTATLELEFDWVRTVKLRGDPRPPAGCRLVPSLPFVDFGMTDPRVSATRRLGLLNVGRDLCDVASVTIDHTAFSVTLAANTIDSQTSGEVVVEFTPPVPATGPTQATLTIASNDTSEPRRELLVVAGHTRCDPTCACTAEQTRTYWRFSSEVVASGVRVATDGESPFQQTCDPQRCAAGQVAVELGRWNFVCAAPPPTCADGEGLDFPGDGWVCVPCALMVQYGFLFDGMRGCAPTPNLSCPANQAPTFDAASRRWSCVATCDNGQYDQHTLPGGGVVCIPC